MSHSRTEPRHHAPINTMLQARKGGPRIPAGPFIVWCERRLFEYGGPDALKGRITRDGRFVTDPTGARDQLAAHLGIAPRTLWRYLHWRDSCGRPTTVHPRWPVEDMLARAGEDFYHVYPEFLHERDVVLAAEAWCRVCREFVNPVDGICLWCDQPVNALDVAA